MIWSQHAIITAYRSAVDQYHCALQCFLQYTMGTGRQVHFGTPEILLTTQQMRSLSHLEQVIALSNSDLSHVHEGCAIGVLLSCGMPALSADSI